MRWSIDCLVDLIMIVYPWAVSFIKKNVIKIIIIANYDNMTMDVLVLIH